MTYTLPHVTDTPIITLEGEIGPAAIIALQRRIVRAVDAGHHRIVVDLSAVSGLGGQTLSLFCGVLRFVNRCGATLAIVGGSADVPRAIDLCELDGVEFHPTAHAALTARTTSPIRPYGLTSQPAREREGGMREHA